MTTTPRLTSKNISDDQFARLQKGFDQDPSAKVAQNAITRTSIKDLAVNHDVVRNISRTMSTRLDDWKPTNQKKSGRCWLFAALNLLRSGAREVLNVKDFEFSQNYAMYWDKFERANYYLQSVLDTADKDADDRLISFLSETLMGDGGQWNMATSIFKKYGVVPKEAMPETQSSSETAQMNARLQTLLRKGGYELRAAAAKGTSEAKLDSKVEELLAGVHRVLTAHLGTPPTHFDWEYTDDDKKFTRVGDITPHDFLDKYTTINLDDYVCLVDDPRAEHAKGKTLTVQYLGNIVGGEPVQYLNVDIQTMKDLAKDALVAGSPVWFGCDVAPNMLREEGLWDAKLFDYDGVYGLDFSLTKEQRVRVGESAMTHAMLFTGVDVAEDGSTRRWRVENSWGDENGDKGFYTMNDSWFDEYMFEVAVDKNKLSPELRAALDEKPIELPAWDPMGALAR